MTTPEDDNTPRILIVEDDERLAMLTQDYLVKNGLEVAIETDGNRAIRRIVNEQPDMVVLDVMLPGSDGLTVCREVRPHYQNPILMLTARTEDMDQVLGLEMGADDYLPKPFEPKELVLRIKNILNKTKRRDLKRVIEFGSIKIDLNKHLIIKNSKEYKINNAEKIILEEMINSPGKTFSRDEIGRILNLDKERSIDVIITRLRKKIESDPKNPKYLQTIRGAGYVLWIE